MFLLLLLSVLTFLFSGMLQIRPDVPLYIVGTDNCVRGFESYNLLLLSILALKLLL